MIHREAEFYGRFRCLGGACPMTCCRDWSIVVDEDSLSDYHHAPAHLREQILNNLHTDEDGDVCFQLREDGTCALLDEDGLCPIQRHWGEEHLCQHCGAYPRFIEEYGCLTESSIAISCPEGARLVLEGGVLPLHEWDDGGDEPPFDGVDEALLAGLVATRTNAFRLLSRQDASIWARLSALLTYADILQDGVEQGTALEYVLPPEPKSPPQAGQMQPLAVQLLTLLATLEPLRSEWLPLLQARSSQLRALSDQQYAALTSDFCAAYPAWEAQLEHLTCYFLFRHWLKVVNDDQLYGRAALAAASCAALFHLAALAWREDPVFDQNSFVRLCAAFSREVEHLDENFAALTNALSDTRAWRLSEIL